MTAREFTGHIRAMRADNDWFGAEDLVGLPDTPFQIIGVKHDEHLKIGGAPSKDKFYLELADASGRECRKKMSINPGRRTMIALLHGGVTKEWKGKWIWVYVDEVKAVGGGKTLGMKIRNKKDAPRGKVAKPVEPSPQAADSILEAIIRAKDEPTLNAIYDAAVGPGSTANLDDNERRQVEAARADRLAVLREGAK